MEKESLSLQQEYLSDIELYFTNPENINDNILKIIGDESKHITNVMRHKNEDVIYVTNGLGSIFESIIKTISKNEILCNIKNIVKYENKYNNIVVAIPRLRSQERFDFAIEKIVELGITNIIIYESERTIAKGEKLDRWNKIAIAAMKQSLRSFLPKIEFAKSIQKIVEYDYEKIWFEQNSNDKFLEYYIDIKNNSKKTILIFGPEGGLSENEKKILNNYKAYRLTENRLRSETAIISTISVLTL